MMSAMNGTTIATSMPCVSTHTGLTNVNAMRDIPAAAFMANVRVSDRKVDFDPVMRNILSQYE